MMTMWSRLARRHFMAKTFWAQHDKSLISRSSIWETNILYTVSPFRATRDDKIEAPMPAVPKHHQVPEDLSDEVGPSVPRRRLEVLSLPTDSEDALVGAHLAGFVQAWHNLLGEHRSTWTLRSCLLLEWESSPPLSLTRTPIHFLMKNKKSDLQEAVDSLLRNGAI